MIDVVQQINAVQRQVGSRVIEAGQARSVIISQVYAATAEDVWDACTNPERIPRWFLPVTGELRLGGRYQLEGNAGGTIERCDPPKSFAATWEFGGQTSWIEVLVSPEPGGRTRLRIEPWPATSGGPSSARGRPASAGIWPCSAWPAIWPPGRH